MSSVNEGSQVSLKEVTHLDYFGAACRWLGVVFIMVCGLYLGRAWSEAAEKHDLKIHGESLEVENRKLIEDTREITVRLESLVQKLAVERKQYAEENRRMIQQLNRRVEHLERLAGQ